MNEPAMLRPLTLGQLLDTTFSLYRQNFVLFFGVAALPYLVTLVFQLLMIAVQKRTPVASGSPEELAALGVIVLGALATMVAYFIVLSISQAASFFAVSAVHLREPITIGGAFARLRGHILVVLGTSLLTLIAWMMGLVFFIVPGVIIWLAMTCAIPAALFENLDPIDAMKRSWELTTGAKGRLFLLGVLWYAVMTGMSAFVTVMVFALAGFSAFARPGSLPVGVMVLQQVMNFFISAVTAPILTVGITLVYYDQRVRKEAFDLQHMMSVLGSQPPPPPPQAAGAGIS